MILIYRSYTILSDITTFQIDTNFGTNISLKYVFHSLILSMIDRVDIL